MQHNPNSIIKLNNQANFNKIKDSKNQSQNINGGMKKSKNSSVKNNNVSNNLNQENKFHNKFLDLIKNRKTPKLNEKNNMINRKNSKTENDLKRNEEYQKIIEKIALLENCEMNYDLYTKLNLIKNYINNKGDKITLEDIKSINNDIDSMIKAMNLNINYKNEFELINNEEYKKKNKLKVTKK